MIELANYILDRVETVAEVTGFINVIPPREDDIATNYAVAVRPLGGEIIRTVRDGREVYQDLTLDLLIRGVRPGTGNEKLDTLAKAEEIRQTLNNYNVSLANSRVISLTTQGIAYAFTDDNQRDNYTCLLNVNFNN